LDSEGFRTPKLGGQIKTGRREKRGEEFQQGTAAFTRRQNSIKQTSVLIK